MARAQLLLDLLLALMLAATLFHAVRLQRALGVFRADRQALDDLIGKFDQSTRAAESGIERLQGMTERADGQITRQAEQGKVLKDDLALLIDRGDQLANRMDTLVRAARPLAAAAPRVPVVAPPAAEEPRMRSQAERDLMSALKAPR